MFLFPASKTPLPRSVVQSEVADGSAAGRRAAVGRKGEGGRKGRSDGRGREKCLGGVRSRRGLAPRIIFFPKKSFIDQAPHSSPPPSPSAARFAASARRSGRSLAPLAPPRIELRGPRDDPLPGWKSRAERGCSPPSPPRPPPYTASVSAVTRVPRVPPPLEAPVPRRPP